MLVLGEVAAERRRQDEKFPGQELPDGTGSAALRLYADAARTATNEAAADGTVTWWDVLHEEWAEAGAEDAQERLREELVHVAAVAVRWVEAIDRRDARQETYA